MLQANFVPVLGLICPGPPGKPAIQMVGCMSSIVWLGKRGPSHIHLALKSLDLKVYILGEGSFVNVEILASLKALQNSFV